MKTADQRIDHILRRMLADRTEDAPAGAVKWAKNLYRMRAVERPAGLFQIIKAAMTVNIAPGELAFGERSGGAGQAQQMLFEAGDHAIDLRIKASGGTVEVRGQVLGTGFDNAEVTLDGPDRSFTATTDEQSTFTFQGVVPGDYGMTISGEAAEIIIEQLTLQ